MSRTDPQFNLRIPAELKTRIEDAAQQNKRSATAEIIARLEASFDLADSSADEAENAEVVARTITLKVVPKIFEILNGGIEYVPADPKVPGSRPSYRIKSGILDK